MAPADLPISGPNGRMPQLPSRPNRSEAAVFDTPRISSAEPKPVAVIRLTIPRSEIQTVMGPAMGELLAAIAAQGIAADGPLFSHHFAMHPDTFDFEVGIFTTIFVEDAGRVRRGESSASPTVAKMTYRGPYEGLGEAWGEFDRWVAAEGHTPAADLWEFYISGPESSPDPAQWRTNLLRPLLAVAR